MSVVSNTSPLIVLAKSGLLHILPRLFTTVTIPQAVRTEVLLGNDNDPMKRALPNCAWLKTVLLQPAVTDQVLKKLGAGEAEAIEVARCEGLRVLLDDRAGRRAAEKLGMTVSGTLSVVALAKQQGIIESFDDAVKRIREAGLFVSEELIIEVRKGPAGKS